MNRTFGESSAGMAIGYSNMSLSEAKFGNIGSINSIYTAIFAGRKFHDIIFSGALSYNANNISQNRAIQAIGTATGTHFDQGVVLDSRIGFPLNFYGVNILPNLGFRYSYFHDNGFAEHGANNHNLSVGADNSQSAQAQIGVILSKKFNERINLDSMLLKFAYARELLDTDRSVSVYSRDGTQFNAPGCGLPLNKWTIGLAFNFHPIKKVEVLVGGNFQFGSNNFSQKNMNIKGMYKF